MPHEIKKLKKPVSKLLSQYSPFHVEIDKSDGAYLMSISGVKRISEFSDTHVALKHGKEILSIRGERLSIALYEDKTVEISGKLEVFEFGTTKN